jgi:hypothetical protein
VITIRIVVLFCNALPIMLLLLLLLLIRRSELASVGNHATFDCKVAVVFTLRWLDGVPPGSGSLVSKLLNLTGRVAEADDTWHCTQQPPRGWVFHGERAPLFAEGGLLPAPHHSQMSSAVTERL